MKKALAIILLTVSGIAAASCPVNAPYRCVPSFGGKMQCGCGM